MKVNMLDDPLLERLERISDFVRFEAETSIIWPWAIPAEELLQNEEKLRTVAAFIHFDANGAYDTDEMYEALDSAFGVNPVLMEKEQSEGGMITFGV